MIAIDLKNHLTITEALPPAAVTASGNGSGIDLKGYIAAMLTFNSAVGSGTAPTLDIKVQDSADNSSFADVSGYTLTQVTGAAGNGVQNLFIDPRLVRRYVRVVKTVGGTSPSFTCEADLIGLKQTI